MAWDLLIQIFGWLCVGVIVFFIIIILVAFMTPNDPTKTERHRQICEEYQKKQQESKEIDISDNLGELDAEMILATKQDITHNLQLLLDNGKTIESGGVYAYSNRTNPSLFDALFEWQIIDDNQLGLYYDKLSIDNIEYPIEIRDYAHKDSFLVQQGETLDVLGLTFYFGVVAIKSPKKGVVLLKYDSENRMIDKDPIFFQPNSLILVLDYSQSQIYKYESEIILAAENERRIVEQKERDEIASKIKERHRLRQLEKEVERELIDNGEILKGVHRPTVPQDVKDAVYRRDGGRCVICGSVDDLQYDHDIPFSKGGATNVENLQILCQKCNSKKSNKIG